MAREFVTVTHPDIPGSRAQMVNPRNGWVPVNEAPIAIPDGEPSTKWTRPQLDAYAATKGVDVSEATSKKAVVALLTGSDD